MIWVLVAIIVVLVAAVGALALRQGRTARLKQGFGPEYDRVVEQHGDPRAAEADLQQRRERRRGFDIRPLDPSMRERYADRWTALQRRFVDAPASAVAEADDLVAEVMRRRGYPIDDFEQRAADVSVDHPETVEHYRQAHAISVASADAQADTEDLRTAMVHFRALFEDLLDDGTDAEDAARHTRHAKERI